MTEAKKKSAEAAEAAATTTASSEPLKEQPAQTCLGNATMCSLLRQMVDMCKQVVPCCVPRLDNPGLESNCCRPLCTTQCCTPRPTELEATPCCTSPCSTPPLEKFKLERKCCRQSCATPNCVPRFENTKRENKHLESPCVSSYCSPRLENIRHENKCCLKPCATPCGAAPRLENTNLKTNCYGPPCSASSALCNSTIRQTRAQLAEREPFRDEETPNGGVNVNECTEDSLAACGTFNSFSTHQTSNGSSNMATRFESCCNGRCCGRCCGRCSQKDASLRSSQIDRQSTRSSPTSSTVKGKSVSTGAAVAKTFGSSQTESNIDNESQDDVFDSFFVANLKAQLRYERLLSEHLTTKLHRRRTQLEDVDEWLKDIKSALRRDQIRGTDTGCCTTLPPTDSRDSGDERRRACRATRRGAAVRRNEASYTAPIRNSVGVGLERMLERIANEQRESFVYLFNEAVARRRQENDERSLYDTDDERCRNDGFSSRTDRDSSTRRKKAYRRSVGNSSRSPDMFQDRSHRTEETTTVEVHADGPGSKKICSNDSHRVVGIGWHQDQHETVEQISDVCVLFPPGHYDPAGATTAQSEQKNSETRQDHQWNIRPTAGFQAFKFQPSHQTSPPLERESTSHDLRTSEEGTSGVGIEAAFQCQPSQPTSPQQEPKQSEEIQRFHQSATANSSISDRFPPFQFQPRRSNSPQPLSEMERVVETKQDQQKVVNFQAFRFEPCCPSSPQPPHEVETVEGHGQDQGKEHISSIALQAFQFLPRLSNPDPELEAQKDEQDHLSILARTPDGCFQFQAQCSDCQPGDPPSTQPKMEETSTSTEEKLADSPPDNTERIDWSAWIFTILDH